YPNSKSITIPQIQVSDAIVDSAKLTIQSASNLAIEAKGGPAMAPEVVGDGRTVRFRAANGALPTEFRIRSQAANPEFSSLEVASAHHDQWAVAIHVRGRISHGDYPELQIRVSGWPTKAPQLVSSIEGLKVKYALQNRDHVWTLSIPPGSPQQISLMIK